uniref:Uncharacterized protein n=1 Tax=Rhizophora mucronata TaxID=61149 RepID=A0A2P2KU19_RHIMU
MDKSPSSTCMEIAKTPCCTSLCVQGNERKPKL